MQHTFSPVTCDTTSAGGLQAPILTDSDLAMVAVGLYVLFGIPIYTFAVGKIAGPFVSGGMSGCAGCNVFPR